MAAESLTVPSRPVTLLSGDYFIWPINIDLEGVILKYATAQVITNIEIARNEYYFFVATPGVSPEFCFDAASVQSLEVNDGKVARSGSLLEIRNITPQADAAFSFHRNNGGKVLVVVLNRDQAGNLWRSKSKSGDRALITESDVFFDGDQIHLRSVDKSGFELRTLPQLRASADAAVQMAKVGNTFTSYVASEPQHRVDVTYQQTRNASQIQPVKLGRTFSWRPQPVAEAPGDDAFQNAAKWTINVNSDELKNNSDLWLEIRYVGEVARLYSGTELLDDDFYDGQSWKIGLKRFHHQLASGPLTLEVVPLRSDAPIYIPTRSRPNLSFDEQIAKVESITAVPEHELIVKQSSH